MSKLVHAVHAGLSRRTPRPLDVLTVKESWTPDKTSEMFAHEYRIGVSLHHRVLLTDDVMHQSETVALKEAVAMVKDAVVEEVFGEFRPHFRAINQALWERDFDKALAALRAMEVQMFSREE